MGIRNILTVLSVSGLAASALAQPAVDYSVLGSISSQWSEKPWPNVNYTPNDARWLLFDFAGGGGVMLGDTNNSWIFRDGAASRVRDNQHQVPGLPAGTLWSSAAAGANSPKLIAAPSGYVMINAGIPSAPCLRTTAGGFERTPYTYAVAENGDSLVESPSFGWGVSRAGVVDEVIPGSTSSSPWTWRPDWSVFGGFGASFPLGITPDGRVWGLARRFLPNPFRRFIFAADPATHTADIVASDRDAVPPLGTIDSLDYLSPTFAGVADDGTLIVEAYIGNAAGVIANGHYALSRQGAWEAVFPDDTDLAALPAGVQFRESNFEAVTINRHARAAGLKQLAGAGVTTANDTVIVAWDRDAGLQVIAREGDQVPGEPAGTLYGNFEALYLSARGDLAFEDGSALYLHHPLVGTTTVARVGRPVAGGLATDLPPTRIATSYYQVTRTRTQALRGGPTYIDDHGVVYFYAHSTPHYVAYAAQLHLPCPADFNADGFVDFFDYSDFVTCFETGACPPGQTADANHDGFVDFFDYSDFVAAFEAGC